MEHRCAKCTRITAPLQVLWFTLGLSVLCIFGVDAVRGADYEFKILVKTGDTIDGRAVTALDYPNINDRGTVAVTGAFSGGAGMFTCESEDRNGQCRLIVRTGDTIEGKVLTHFASNPAINNRGAVAFVGIFSEGHGMFTCESEHQRGQCRLTVQTGDTIEGKVLTNISSLVAVNDRGVAAILSSFSDGLGIFTQSRLLARTGDQIDSVTLTSFGSIPTINNGGTVAFVGRFSGGFGIFTQSKLLAKTGDNIDGKPLTGFASYPTINNRGTVVFIGGCEISTQSGCGIFTQARLVVETGDVIDGKTLTSFASFPTINDRGMIGFLADFSGGSGIFTQSKLIVKTGDVIGGKTVMTIGTPNQIGLNNAGEIVFRAIFSDWSQAIVRARRSNPDSE